MRTRVVPTALAIGLLALAGAYAIQWHVAADALREGLVRFIDGRRAEGYRIEHGEISLGGFPAAIAVRMEAPLVAAPDGRWRWSAPAILLRTWAWRTHILDIEMPGRHAIAGGGNEFPIDAGAANISLALPSRRATDIRSNSLRFVLLAADIALAGSTEPALGRKVSELAIEGAVVGPFGGRSAPLGAWRDGGGTLEIARLRFVWGPLTAEGDGTFALDEAMRPIGAASVRLAGYDAAIDRLVEAGALTPRHGLTYKSALAAFAQASPDGEAVAQVPLTLQDAFIYVGPIALAGLPAIE